MGRAMRKLALIVVDMQNYFINITRPSLTEKIVGPSLTEKLLGPSLTEKLRDLAAFMRSRGVPVVYTQHGSPDPPNEEDSDVLVAFLGAENSIKCVSSMHL